MSKVASTLNESLASLVTAMGYEYVGCELTGGRGALLRIYIDNEKGITLDDCTRVSYQVSAMLDVEDPIQGQYSLEISSPGLDRPLFELSQYRKQIGKRVKIRVYTPIDNRRKLVGVLLRVEEDMIYLDIDGEEIKLPFSAIDKANVVADIR